MDLSWVKKVPPEVAIKIIIIFVFATYLLYYLDMPFALTSVSNPHDIVADGMNLVLISCYLGAMEGLLKGIKKGIEMKTKQAVKGK